MAKSFFENLGSAIFQPAGDVVSGAVTALQPGRVQQIQRDRSQQDIANNMAVLRSDVSREVKERAGKAILRSMDPKLLEAMNKAGTSVLQAPDADVDPRASILERFNKLGTARSKFETQGRVDPRVAPFFDQLTEGMAREADSLFEVKGGMTDRVAAAKSEPIDAALQESSKRPGGKKKVDRRDMFNGGSIFDEIPAANRAHVPSGKKFKGVQGIFDPGKAIGPSADFFQVGTSDFPTGNVPSSLSDIGITAKDDIQTFGEMEKKLPNMDLRSQYQQDPGTFQAIMKALRAGKKPDGTPFTLKDAITMIKEAGQ